MNTNTNVSDPGQQPGALAGCTNNLTKPGRRFFTLPSPNRFINFGARLSKHCFGGLCQIILQIFGILKSHRKSQQPG